MRFDPNFFWGSSKLPKAKDKLVCTILNSLDLPWSSYSFIPTYQNYFIFNLIIQPLKTKIKIIFKSMKTIDCLNHLYHCDRTSICFSKTHVSHNNCVFPSITKTSGDRILCFHQSPKPLGSQILLAWYSSSLISYNFNSRIACVQLLTSFASQSGLLQLVVLCVVIYIINHFLLELCIGAYLSNLELEQVEAIRIICYTNHLFQVSCLCSEILYIQFK